MAFKKTRKTFYGTETFHENPDKPGEYVIQKTFDRQPFLDDCARIRAEVNQNGKELRLEMRIPPTVFFEWIRNGKLSPDDYRGMPNGGIAIDPKKLAALKRDEFAGLSCT